MEIRGQQNAVSAKAVYRRGLSWLALKDTVRALKDIRAAADLGKAKAVELLEELEGKG